MRILHATESRGWSGGTIQLWRLCEELKGRGHAVALFCPPEGELLKHTAGSGVDVFASSMRQDYDLAAAWKLAGACRSFKPDIVHAHHPRAHALALLAGFAAPVPRLVVSRRVSFRLNKWNPFSQWKYRTGRVTMYTAVSDDIRRVLLEGGVDEGRVEVIHSGVDIQRFSPRPAEERLRGELGLPLGKPIVGNLTHYSWWKGQRIFLEAAQGLVKAGVNAHFLLVGKDTDGGEARARVRDLGIEPHVTLAGFRRDIPEVLSLLAVSVVSSLAGEGFSGVLRESMSMGVPVAATDVGGNRELVVDGRTGLLVPPANGFALAQAVRRLLEDKTLAGSCAKAARDNICAHYSIDTMVSKTIRLYEKLLAA